MDPHDASLPGSAAVVDTTNFDEFSLIATRKSCPLARGLSFPRTSLMRVKGLSGQIGAPDNVA